MTQDDLLTLAQRLREYNHNPHHINPVSDAFHRLITDSADALSQLAAIQGGMGEVVELKRPGAWKMFSKHYREGFNEAEAQHQRITAAMAAEVERLSEDYDKAWRHAGMNLENLGKALADNTKLRAELAAYKAISPYRIRRLKAVTKERDALRAELAATSEAQAHTSEAAPGVVGLVKALEDCAGRLRLLIDSRRHKMLDVVAEEKARAALSTWRQAHTPSTLPASSAEE